MSNLAHALVQQHAPLVKRIAFHLKARLPVSVQVDDLIQAGMIGLLEASENYQPERGATFETYSGIRIRGAMLDELRRNDWAPKSVHRKQREISRAIRAIETRTGRDARDDEIVQEMNITHEEYFKILQDINTARVFFFDEAGIEEDEWGSDSISEQNFPFEYVFQQQFKEQLAQAIAGLPEREKMAVTLYYDSGLHLKEIGLTLGVSESRVSQLLSQALVRLRARMGEYEENLVNG